MYFSGVLCHIIKKIRIRKVNYSIVVFIPLYTLSGFYIPPPPTMLPLFFLLSFTFFIFPIPYFQTFHTFNFSNFHFAPIPSFHFSSCSIFHSTSLHFYQIPPHFHLTLQFSQIFPTEPVLFHSNFVSPTSPSTAIHFVPAVPRKVNYIIKYKSIKKM